MELLLRCLLSSLTTSCIRRSRSPIICSRCEPWLFCNSPYTAQATINNRVLVILNFLLKILLPLRCRAERRYSLFSTRLNSRRSFSILGNCYKLYIVNKWITFQDINRLNMIIPCPELRTYIQLCWIIPRWYCLGKLLINRTHYHGSSLCRHQCRNLIIWWNLSHRARDDGGPWDLYVSSLNLRLFVYHCSARWIESSIRLVKLIHYFTWKHQHILVVLCPL